jgi:hypothetical protein
MVARLLLGLAVLIAVAFFVGLVLQVAFHTFG